MKKKSFFKMGIAMALMGCIMLSGCQGTEEKEDTDTAAAAETEKEKVSLLVYSGAGLKNAMEEVKTAFEAENEGVAIEYVYAGSAQLLGQMESSGKGDVFIVGSEVAYNAANEKGLAGEKKLVAHHTPTIAVPKGNPKGITSLEDLGREGIRLALGDSKSNAIGKTADKIIEKNALQNILDNVVTRTATVNEITTVVASGDVDAGIVTEDAVYSNEKIEIVKIDETQNIDQIIPVCSLKSSEESELADKFVDFIASEKGKAIFEKNGFKPVAE